MRPPSASAASPSAMTSETPSVALKAGEASAQVHPGHGCLIGALRLGDQELLWRHGQPRTLRSTNSRGAASAEEFDDEILIGGWFPMFPSAGLPDDNTQQHGWAPRVSWDIAHQTTSAVTALARGPFLNGGTASLRRVITLTDTALRVDTRIINEDNHDDGLFTFGEHPCFARSTFAGSALAVNGRTLSIAPANPDRHAGHHHTTGTEASMTTASESWRFRVIDVAGSLPYWLLWENYEADELTRADTFAWEPSSSPGAGIEQARHADALIRLSPGSSTDFAVRCEWTPVVDNDHLESVT